MEEVTKVTVAVGGYPYDPEAREVEARVFVREDGSRVGFVDGVVGIVGRGKALYPTTLYLFEINEDAPEKYKHYSRGNLRTTDAEGRGWQYHMGATIRNRQASIVGWADTLGVTNAQDQTRVDG